MEALDIYIIHSQNLAIRKNIVEQLVTQLSKSGLWSSINSHYITQHDPQDINVEMVKQMIKLDKSCNDTLFDSLVQNMHIKQISNVLKHMEALRRIVVNTEKDDKAISLVIEDDVIFSDDIAIKLQTTLKNAQETAEWDAIYLGFPQPSTAPNKPLVSVQDFFRIHPTCDSYLVTKSSAKKLLDNYIPIRFSNNIQQSYIGKVHELKTFFAIPNIFADGSKYGIYISTLEPNGRLFLNPDYNTLSTLINKDSDYTPEDKKKIDGLIEKLRYKNHPDMLHLIGVYHARCKKAYVAKSCFEEAFKGYQQNDALINNTSDFLINYIRLYKLLQ